MSKIETAKTKAIAVIDSCTNMEHVIGAKHYVLNFCHVFSNKKKACNELLDYVTEKERTFYS